VNDLIRESMAHVWAMEPKALRRLMATFAAIPQDALDKAIAARIQAGAAQAFDNLQGNPSAEVPPRAEVRDGVAHIRIAGPILKSVPSIFELFGIEATSTETVREMLGAAVEDDAVKSIVLDVDSPGGTIEGVAELAGDVRAASGLKPVRTHAADLMASAAYWIGCQAGTVSCGPTAAVGSIGVYSVMEDTSAIAEKAGVKVHVVSSHELKGAGVEGSKITEAQLADAQRVIDSYAALFTAAVAEGRKLDPEAAKAVSTGQVWIGQEAADLGLVDLVHSSDAAHASAAIQSTHVALAEEFTAPERATEESNMAENQELAQLRARLEAAEAATKAERTARVDGIIKANRDRIAPAQVEAVRKVAASCSTVEEFEAFVLAMPVQTNAAPVASVDAHAEDVEVDEAEAAVARKLETSPKSVATYSQVAGWFSDGRLKLEDGRIVTKAELEKGI
jgi:signal peptide peptidase SppA